MQFTNAQQAALRYDKNIIVEAGAGSGKTAVFVQRYINILSENPDILPENILAITFTNKAAHECFQRIRDHVLDQHDDPATWLEHLSRAHISTIHGFCSYVIRAHCLALQLPLSMAILDEQDRVYFFRMAIKESLARFAEENNPDLKAYMTSFSLQRLSQDLERLFYKKAIFQKHYDQLKHKSCLSDEERFICTLGALFDATYATFTALKERLSLLDYDDLFEQFKRLLSNPAIRAELQQQFRYIMVDECQDVDPEQWECIQQLVSDHDPLQQSKLFLVGDAKQSIYGFRGADLRFFSMLSNSFSDASSTCNTVYLNDNFRTSNAVLSFINPMFQQLFETGSATHLAYHALIPFRETTGAVSCMLLKDAIDKSDEVKGIYYWIEETLQKHPDYTYSDIAILCRQRKQCHQLKTQLEGFGLPVHIDREPGFFQQQVVIDLFQFIKALCLPNDNLAWIAVLRSPIFGFTASLVHLLFTETKATRFLNKVDEARQ